MNFESVAFVIGVLLGGVLYFKSKADKSKKDAIMGQTEGQDKILRENQDEAHSEVVKNAEAILQLEIEREKQRKEYERKTREERAKDWKN